MHYTHKYSAPQAEDPPVLPLLPRGSRLPRGYSTIGTLGTGGQGNVYLARHEHDCDLTVIKVASTEHVPFLSWEHAMLSQLDHPGIPRAYDFFLDDQGQGYLVMQCKATLGTLAQRQRGFVDQRLPLEEAMRLIIGTCDILDYLHTRPHPVIHCDIKPGNLLLNQRGMVTLIDFGLARSLTTPRPPHLTGGCFGTPGYMAPEYLTWGIATPQSDLYSLGATLFSLVYGAFRQRLPLSLPIPWLGWLNGWEEVEPISALLARLLAADPQSRPASARQVHDLLLAHLPLPSRPTRPARLPARKRSS